jgi:hypothetical protein
MKTNFNSINSIATGFLPLGPAKPAKFHLKLLKIIFSADELAIDLAEKSLQKDLR